MITHIGVVTILVRDQNEALQFSRLQPSPEGM